MSSEMREVLSDLVGVICLFLTGYMALFIPYLWG